MNNRNNAPKRVSSWTPPEPKYCVPPLGLTPDDAAIRWQPARRRLPHKPIERLKAKDRKNQAVAACRDLVDYSLRPSVFSLQLIREATRWTSGNRSWADKPLRLIFRLSCLYPKVSRPAYTDHPSVIYPSHFKFRHYNFHHPHSVTGNLLPVSRLGFTGNNVMRNYN